MAQIVNLPTLGGTFGTSLGQGLQQILSGKLEQMRTQNSLEKLGFKPEQAAGLSDVHPDVRNVLIKQLMKQQGNSAFAQGLFDTFGGTPSTVQPNIDTEGQALDKLVNMPTGNQPSVNNADLSSSLGSIGKEQSTTTQPNFMSKVNRKALERMNPNDQMRYLDMVQKADYNERKLKQNERLIEKKFELEGISTARDASFTKAYKDIEKSNTVIKNAEDSIRTSNSVMNLLKTGQVDTGLKRIFKEKLGIENWATPTTQEVAKLLASEPIRSLSTIPGQAARLSKVFDTITKMTPNLTNTREGLMGIAQIRNIESEVLKKIETETIKEKQKYIDKNKTIPVTVEVDVVKRLQPELKSVYNKFYDVIGENLASDNPEFNPTKFGVGTILTHDGIDMDFKLVTQGGKKIWKPLIKG